MSQQLLRTFLVDCGASSPLVLSVTDAIGMGAQRYVMDGPYAVIGRHAESSIRSDEAGVSKRHAYLQVICGRLFCVNLGSRTGMRCADKPFVYGWLSSESPVQIDTLRVQQECSPDEPASVGTPWLENPLEQRIDEPGLFPFLRAKIYEKGELRGEWQMRQFLVFIGRGPLARLQLRHPTVSRYHCSLVGTAGGVWLVDLLSSTGTVVNGVSVRCARIGAGDRVAVGSFELHFSVSQIEAAHAGLAAPEREPVRTDFPGPLVPVAPAIARRAEPPGSALVPRQSHELASAQPQNLVAILQQFATFQEHMLDQFQQSMLMMLKMFTSTHNDQMEAIRKELSRLQEVQLELLALRHQQPPQPVPGPANGSASARDVALNKSAASPPLPAASTGERPPGPAPAEAPRATSPDVHLWLAQRIAGLEKERETVWQRLMGFVLGKNG